MDLSKYKRAFLFGCSFTTYYWPTWADLIKQEINNTHVYAKVGAGNQYIYQAIVEATLKHNINKDDLVIVMLSNVTREDRYTRNDGWITPGNLFYQDTYDEKFLKKFFCEKGYLMRDLSLIAGMDSVLKLTNTDYYFTSIVPLDSLSSDEIKMKDVDDIISLYKPVLDKIKPSVFELIFNNNWNSRLNRPKYKTHWSTGIYTDNHPTTNEHLEYLCKIFPTIKFKDTTLHMAQESTERLFNCGTYDDIIQTFKDIIIKPEDRL